MLHAHGPVWSAASFALAATAMMSVMMAPTVGPWVVAFHRLARGPNAALGGAWSTALFAVGYLAAWLAFAIVVAFARIVVAMPAGWGGALLIGAGLYQLSPLKQACLTHCRSPFSFLLARWKDGPRPALALGFAHGVYCLGCCWALMLTMFVAGLASGWWMAALAAVTFAEQVAPFGARLRVPIGIALIAMGVWRW
ncbi:MAG: DUF2182 domain-containing protein [Acidobacteriota bacterium]